MTKEKELALVREFPDLYRDYGSKTSCMGRGFSHDDGWFDLVHQLSRDIVEVARRKRLDVTATQVKEKFAGLRFYISGGNDPDIRELIRQAEAKSLAICESCGKEGSLKSFDGWHTRCDSCHSRIRAKWEARWTTDFTTD